MKTFTPDFRYPNEKTLFQGEPVNGKIVQVIDGSGIDKTWWPCFFPSVICLLTSGGKDETNIMTCACVTVVDRHPFKIGFPVFSGGKFEDALASREKPRLTMSLIEKHEEFVVNVAHVSPKLVRAIVVCGSHSGRDVDKIGRSGLELLPAKIVDTPIVKECALNLECGLHSVTLMGTHNWVVGQVRAVHMDEELLTGEKEFHWRSLPELVSVDGKS